MMMIMMMEKLISSILFNSALNVTGGNHFFNGDVTIPGDLFVQAGVSLKSGIRFTLERNFNLAPDGTLSGSGLTTVTGTFQWSGTYPAPPTLSVDLASRAIAYNVNVSRFFILLLLVLLGTNRW